jgi:hypothetical protein
LKVEIYNELETKDLGSPVSLERRMTLALSLGGEEGSTAGCAQIPPNAFIVQGYVEGNNDQACGDDGKIGNAPLRAIL